LNSYPEYPQIKFIVYTKYTNVASPDNQSSLSKSVSLYITKFYSYIRPLTKHKLVT